MFNTIEIEQQLGCKLENIASFIVIDGEQLFPGECDCVSGQNQRAEMVLRNIYGGVIEETITVTFGAKHSRWRREIMNVSGSALALTELGITFGGISFSQPSEKDYFYHLENPRVYQRMTIGVDEFQNPHALIDEEGEFDPLSGNKWVDPGVVSERIGASPYQPFPAILLSNYGARKGLVHGTLSQDVFYHNYTVKHVDDALEFSVFSSFKAVSDRTLAPGEVLEDYWYLGGTDKADSLNELFSDYINVLKETIPMSHGRNDTNRHSVVWGSWNDGIFRDMDEKRILEMADFISKNMPTVEWIKIYD